MGKATFKMVILCVFVLLWCGFSSSFALTDEEKKLSEATEAYCSQTAKEKATIDKIKEKVRAGAALIEKEGKASFGKFKGNGSEFIFCGTYIWINDIDGNMLMHPIKPGLENKSQLGLKDANGYKLFVDLVDLARKKDEGWIKYVWPKPGTKENEDKYSFFKKVKMEGNDVLVCAGIYASQAGSDDVKAIQQEIVAQK